MKSTFRILFYVKRDKQKSDGTLPIMCRITIDGQPSRFNTKVSINPNIWDAKASVAIGKSNEAVEINALLNEHRQMFRHYPKHRSVLVIQLCFLSTFF